MLKYALLALSLLACSSGDGDDFSALACDPGETQACVCDSGDDGAQECEKSGKGWDDCECAGGGTGGTSGTGGASGSSGTGSGGTGGSDSKECEIDSDCPTTDEPYCIEWECVFRLGPNSDCDNFLSAGHRERVCGAEADTGNCICAPGLTCTETGAGSVPQCKPE